MYLHFCLRNPNLLLNQCKNSTEYLQTLSTKKYDEIKSFLVSLSGEPEL